MGFVSYAQNNEDVLLHRVFGGQQTGFYVDVGAYHPVNGSVTKAFYDRGWSGINVEPGTVYDELDAARPRDINLRMAVLDRQGEVVFLEDANDRGTSHVLDQSAPGTVTVPCDTLEGLLRTHGRGRPIDFLKIDAEGAEWAIVSSTNWRTLRPRVLVIEATLPWSSVLSNQRWEPQLLEQGYIRAYFDGINCFYVPEEEATTLAHHFSTPVNVLDGALPYSAVEALSALEACRVRITALDDRVRDLDAAAESATSAWQAAVHERDVLLAEKERLAESQSALLAERDGIWQQLNAVRQNQQQTNAVPSVSPETEAEPEAQAVESPAPPKPKLSRRIAKKAYAAIRPIARPLAWRLRSFMTADLAERLNVVQSHVASLAEASPQVIVQRMDHSEGLAELRRLSGEIENMLLTLAMESSTSPRAAQADAESRTLN